MRSLDRTKKREKKPAVQLFNKLFFEFVNFLHQNSNSAKGMLFVNPVVWEKLQKFDDEWKLFCDRVKRNPIKTLEFKFDYFMTEADKHIDRLIGNSLFNQLRTKINPYMHTIEIPDIKFKAEIPAGIEEMNRKQYIKYSGLLAKLLNKEISFDQLKTEMVFTFMKIRKDKLKYEKLAAEQKFNISANVYKIGELLDYFFTLEDDKIKVNLSWTKSLIRRISSRIFFYYGPKDALTDITFLEYKDANSYYRKFSETHDESDLNRLIAVLYRPMIMGHKFKYNPDKIEKRANRIGKIPYNIRFGIFLFYTACEEFLRTGSFKADGNTINLEILYTVTTKEKKLADKVKHKDETGLTGLANSLAKTGIYGTVDKVYSQNLYDVLILLYQQRIEYLNQLDNMDIK